MKKRIFLPMIIILLAMLGAAAAAFAIPASERADTLREQLTLGERYLSDGDFESAVRAAAAAAREGDVVLMSPASASFDQFKNFMVRGECFKTIVREL